jgi:hypothetical protein
MLADGRAGVRSQKQRRSPEQREGEMSQGIQSARLSIRSSELGPPTPLTRKSVLVPPPFWVQGGTHSLAGEGVRGPSSDDGQTLWYSRYTAYNPSTGEG